MREAVVALGHVDGETLTDVDLDRYLDVRSMTGTS